MDNKKYILKVSLHAIEHLGINLYSSTPAVLSEVIANAYDADATEVHIQKQDEIIITDNGMGMNVSDINNKYLKIGYKRREEEKTSITPNGRKVMGRKGVGKLSLFAIASTITVITKKAEKEVLGFILKLKNIREYAKKDEKYHPEELPSDEIDKYVDKIKYSGTVIILNDLRKKRIIETQIKQSIARRFACIGKNFAITYNSDLITYEDRNYFKELEFSWTINEEEIPQGIREKIPQNIDKQQNEKIKWSGWIGSFKKHNKEDNKIALIVHKKIAIENILDYLDIHLVGADYLVGEIYADYLDDTDHDIATTSRQGIIEDDESFKNLLKELKDIISDIAKEWVSKRREKGADDIFALFPPVQEWYNNLTGNDKRVAKAILGKIHTFKVTGKDKKDLVKSGVLAVEKSKFSTILENFDSFDSITKESLKGIGQLLQQQDDWEATAYYEITQSRLKVIDILQKHIDDNEKEKVIQSHIFDNLWLLDPGWERPTEDKEMEQALKKHEKSSSSSDEQKGRIDIKYRVSGLEHVIVELKKADISYDHYKILPQVDKYIKNVEEQLKSKDKDNEWVRTVLLVGDKAYKKYKEDKRYQADMKDRHVIVQSYSSIIHNSQQRYQEYIEQKQKIVNPIMNLIHDIEECEIALE